MARGLPKYRISLSSVTADTYTCAIPVGPKGIQNTNPMWTPSHYDPREVSSWIDRQGVAIPLMKVKTERTAFPDGYAEFELDYYERLPQLEEKLAEVSTKAKASSQAFTKGGNMEDNLKKQIKAILKKAGPFLKWEDEEFRRIFYGYKHFTGKHYFYYNYGWIEEVGDDGGGIGAIRPDYRTTDNWLFRRIIEAEKTRSGDMWVKRRRIGATWVAAADSVYDVLFKNGANLFLTYDLLDAEKFLRRVVFMNDRLPRFLKKLMERDNIRTKIFTPSKRISEAMGASFEEAIKTSIATASSNDEKSVTGGTSSKVILDEIGEMKNLRQILSWATPRLNGSDGFTRAGCLFLFGTVGSMDKAGPVVQTLASNPAANNHKVALVKGTYGVKVDDFGNDLEDEAEQMILEQRQILQEAEFYEELAAFKQKYPLEWADCWVYNTIDKLMPIRNIAIAREQMVTSSWNRRKVFGLFFKSQTGLIEFQRMEPEPSPIKTGHHDDFVGYNQWLLWEPVKPSTMVHPYGMGCDPVDIDKNLQGNPRARGTAPKGRNRLSDITAAVYKRSIDIGGLSDFWVAEYKGRPFPLEEAFEQILLAAEYFGCQINVERNKGAAFIAYANTTGRAHLLFYGTGVAMGLSDAINDPGFNNTERWWTQMISHMRGWWLANTDKPVSPRFMYESEVVKEENTDVFVSYAAALQHSIELDLRERSGQQREHAVRKHVATDQWVRRSDGTGKFMNVALNNPHAMTAKAREEWERRMGVMRKNR